MKSPKKKGRFASQNRGFSPKTMRVLVVVLSLVLVALIVLAVVWTRADQRPGGVDPSAGGSTTTQPPEQTQPEIRQTLATEPTGQTDLTQPVETEQTVPGETTPEQTVPAETQGQSNWVPPQTTPPKQTEPIPDRIEEGTLSCDEFGSYTGQFVEDGRDELVEQVAAIRVTNRSDRFLDFATITFSIDGRAATFVVTGLPAGRSAWVLEATGLTVGQTADFTYIDSVSSFRDGVVAQSNDLDIASDGNMLTVTNNGGETLENVFIYYRTVHTDGYFLGGITYRVDVGTLAPGESGEVLAGHYAADTSEIIRVGWQGQDNGL